MSPPNDKQPPRGKLVSAVEQDGRAEPRGRSLRHTNPGIAPAPPPMRDADEAEDTGMRSADSLVVRLAERTRIETELREQIATLSAQVAAKPAHVESDDSVIARVVGKLLMKRATGLVLLVLAAGAPGGYAAIKSASDPKPATVPVVTEVRTDVTAVASAQAAMLKQREVDLEIEAKRWRVVMPYLCLQGLRADDLGKTECDTMQEKADFAAQPLSGKKTLQWKTRLPFPEIPAPPPK